MLRNRPIVNDPQSASLAVTWHSPTQFTKTARSRDDCSALGLAHQEPLHGRIVVIIQEVSQIASEGMQFDKNHSSLSTIRRGVFSLHILIHVQMLLHLCRYAC